jgi:hypothetical protein
MVDIYSPTLVAAQEELLQSLAAQRQLPPDPSPRPGSRHPLQGRGVPGQAPPPGAWRPADPGPWRPPAGSRRPSPSRPLWTAWSLPGKPPRGLLRRDRPTHLHPGGSLPGVGDPGGPRAGRRSGSGWASRRPSPSRPSPGSCFTGEGGLRPAHRPRRRTDGPGQGGSRPTPHGRLKPGMFATGEIQAPGPGEAGGAVGFRQSPGHPRLRAPPHREAGPGLRAAPRHRFAPPSRAGRWCSAPVPGTGTW